MPSFRAYKGASGTVHLVETVDGNSIIMSCGHDVIEKSPQKYEMVEEESIDGEEKCDKCFGNNEKEQED
jgi:hypothetical protein